jgi:2-dehydro-3-deoxyphosphogluconate aldolase/(4S)-4-hydroxy-2-oxoglutarate aldolase
MVVSMHGTDREPTDIYQRISELKVVPVIVVESEDAALPLVDALSVGGLPIVEITFRTACAALVIRRLKKERPELLVGAGTVTSAELVNEAKACGADFAVAPGLNPIVVKAAQAAGLPLIPGVMTPTDVEAALSLGSKVLKFFPAEAAGGLQMLRSLAAPYAHLGVRFVPTGGLNLNNVTHYLAEKTVLAIGGTWLAKREDIAAGHWDKIASNCKILVELIARH